MDPLRSDALAGLLLVGHGTRDPAGLAELRAVREQLAAAHRQTMVEHCFLELAEPTIAQGIDRLAHQGVHRLIVQPLLLFAAGHAQRDIPEEVSRAARRHPQIELHQAPPFGCHPRLLELSELRFREAIDARPHVPDAETFLLLVGRGSHDPQANSEMARFARLRWEQRRLGWVETCFLAMTWPSLAEGLAMAAACGKRRIVVQPHLLFQGELLARIQAETSAAAARHRHHEWLTTGHLGPHALLVEALENLSGLSRVQEEMGGRDVST